MAWFKCFSQSGGHIEPPEWDIEMNDVVLDEPIELGNGNYTIGFMIDTNVSAYNNNNAVGFVSLRERGSGYIDEPDAMDCSIEFAINSYCIIVFIRGRLAFGDSDAQHKAVGEITGASRTFVGDYRNKPLNVRYSADGISAEFSCSAEGVPSFSVSISTTGIPVAWEEGHEGDWEYITEKAYPPTNNYSQLGAWYGGAGHYTFDGTIKYLRIKQNEEEE